MSRFTIWPLLTPRLGCSSLLLCRGVSFSSTCGLYWYCNEDCLVSAGRWWMSWLPLHFLWSGSSECGKLLPFIADWRHKSWLPPWPPLTLFGKGPVTDPWDEIAGSLLDLLWHNPRRDAGHLTVASLGWKCSLLTWLCLHRWGWGHSFFYGI